VLVRPNLPEFRWKIRKFVETSVHVDGRREWTPGSNHPRAEISQARRGGRFGEPPPQIVAAFHVNSAVPDKGSRTINYSNINPVTLPHSNFLFLTLFPIDLFTRTDITYVEEFLILMRMRIICRELLKKKKRYETRYIWS